MEAESGLVVAGAWAEKGDGERLLMGARFLPGVVGCPGVRG